MMNWVETPAVLALPHAHGDTMRGEVFHVTVMHTRMEQFESC